MDHKLDVCNCKRFSHFEVALKGLDKASEIAVRMGMFPAEVNRLKELELKELRQYFFKR